MNQEDSDQDGIGDACDFCEGKGAYDLDGDGVCDEEDNYFYTSQLKRSSFYSCNRSKQCLKLW